MQDFEAQKEAYERQRNYQYEQKIMAEFWEKHKDAREIVCTKDGKPMAAIYVTPWGDNQEQFKGLMKMVQDRMVYACDMDQ
jgi:hypothetical protein